MTEIIVKLFIISILIYLSVTDIRTMKVPDKVTAMIFLAGIIMMIIGDEKYYFYINGWLIMSVISIATALISRGLGGGDVKLFSALGLCLGAHEALKILVFSFLMAGIFIAFIRVLPLKNSVLLIIKSKKEIPFVPFIALSAFLIFTENLLYCL